MKIGGPKRMQLNQNARARLIAASAIGTIVEWYDFFIFVTMSVLVFDKVFFPTSDPYMGIILSLSVYAVGFIARPLGGIVFGTLGDKIGRKRTLVASLLLMGLATVLIGVLPTYAQAGILAPALLVLMRVLQGVAVGGEATGALLIVAESMPAERRGFWTAFPMIGGPAANVIAAAVIGWVQGFWGGPAFLEWSWRVPFLASILLVLFGFWVRSRIEESPAFVEAMESKRGRPAESLTARLGDNLKPMGQVLLVKTAENTMLYLFTTFFLIMTTTYLALPRGVGLNALLWGSALEVVMIFIAAYASDLIGRRPVMLIGLIGAIAAGFGLFTLEKGGDPSALLRMTLITLSFHGIIVGGMSAFFTEIFPTSVRYTAMSTSYQVASVIGGSVAPIIGTILLEKTGTPFSVAIYATCVAVPAILCVLLSKETRGRDLTALDEATPSVAASSTMTRASASL